MSEVHAAARRVSAPILGIGLATLILISLFSATSFRRFHFALEKISESLSKGTVDDSLMITTPELQPLASTIMEYQEQLRMASASEVAASVVHEIRNPFTSIRGFSQLLRQGEADPRRQYYLDTVIQEVDRVNEIISNFLEFARPAHPSKRFVSVERIFTDLDAMMGGTCLGAGVDLSFYTEIPDTKVWCDRNQLKQVLLNLVQNALQAIASMDDFSEGKIMVSSEIDKDHVKFQVIDNGPGIPPEHAIKVFEPFYSTKAVGTGLGLSICRQLMINQGGTINLETEPGRGTTLFITLPINPPDQDLT